MNSSNMSTQGEFKVKISRAVSPSSVLLLSPPPFSLTLPPSFLPSFPFSYPSESEEAIHLKASKCKKYIYI